MPHGHYDLIGWFLSILMVLSVYRIMPTKFGVNKPDTQKMSRHVNKPIEHVNKNPLPPFRKRLTCATVVHNTHAQLTKQTEDEMTVALAGSLNVDADFLNWLASASPKRIGRIIRCVKDGDRLVEILLFTIKHGRYTVRQARHLLKSSLKSRPDGSLIVKALSEKLRVPVDYLQIIIY